MIKTAKLGIEDCQCSRGAYEYPEPAEYSVRIPDSLPNSKTSINTRKLLWSLLFSILLGILDRTVRQHKEINDVQLIG